MTPDGLGPGAGRAVIVEEELAILFGGKEAWRDRINPHTFGGPFARKEEGQIDDAGLCGRVGDNPGQWQVSRNTGDVDDTALAAGGHSRPEFLAGQQCASHEV